MYLSYYTSTLHFTSVGICLDTMKNKIHFKRVVSVNMYLSIKEFIGYIANILDFKFVH